MDILRIYVAQHLVKFRTVSVAVWLHSFMWAPRKVIQKNTVVLLAKSNVKNNKIIVNNFILNHRELQSNMSQNFLKTKD